MPDGETSELHSGERQVAATVEGIRRDHVARYEWAARQINSAVVFDFGCGVGYGSAILAARANRVIAIDRSEAGDRLRREELCGALGRANFLCLR
jgi:protein-L-isoaspartate O-methyltransferase